MSDRPGTDPSRPGQCPREIVTIGRFSGDHEWGPSEVHERAVPADWRPNAFDHPITYEALAARSTGRPTELTTAVN